MSRLRRFTGREVLGVLALIGSAVAALRLMNRRWWCEAGSLSPWSGDIHSAHTSQHLFDPYTFTHVLHGIAFYGILWLLLRKWLDPVSRWIIAIGLESSWEVLENTRAVIERYRESTFALGYYGDSVLNSLGDIAACALGYGLAAYLPAWSSVAGFLAVEAVLAWWIRDGLLLNILMLIRPIDAVKTWQQMGS